MWRRLMTHRTILPAGVALALMAGLPLAQAAEKDAAKAEQAKPPEVRIPFAKLNIRNWQADGNRAFYVQSRARQWYHAELMAPCINLPFAVAIGFVIDPMGSFDRFSAIVVKNEVCHVKSLVRSDPPPKKGKDKDAK